jgi:GntR family transcriptional regulator
MTLPFSPDALNRNLPTPLYDQLTILLLESIRREELKPGDLLPAEWLIAQEFRVSKATVRRALDELANRGILERFQGRGTFVAMPRVSLGPTHFESFSVQMMARGLRPSSRVLEQRVVAAEGEIAQKLGVAEGSRILRLRRIRLADEQPMGVQTAHVPLELAPGLENRDFQRTSLYRILKEDYGLVAAYAQETHSAIALESDWAKLLAASIGTPALSSRRLTLLASRRPMELVYSVMRGDRYEVFLELSANAMGGE